MKTVNVLSALVREQSSLVKQADGFAYRDLNKNGRLDVYEDTRRPIDERVEDLLGQMTLEEKVGQMTQADQEFVGDVDHVREYMLGSVLSGGGSDPPTNSFEDWRTLYERYQAKAGGSLFFAKPLT